jgi:7-carboxy-7-deazaguanine synthase
MSLDDILAQISGFPCKLVELTGGEPLIQTGTPKLVDRLISEGYTVLMETNGSFALGGLDERCVKIVDVKCPSSGESHNNRYDNLDILGPSDQIKFVIQDKEDYLFSRDLVRNKLGNFNPHHILFSPVEARLPACDLAKWILDDGLPVRLHIQLHKHIWPHITRGV